MRSPPAGWPRPSCRSARRSTTSTRTSRSTACASSGSAIRSRSRRLRVLRALGLEEDLAHARDRVADVALDPCDRVLDAAGVEAVDERDLEVDEDLLGPDVHRQQVAQAVDVLVVLHDAGDLRADLAAGGLADQEVLGL